MKNPTGKAPRSRIISAEDISAKRRQLSEMEAAFDKQEMDKLVRAARATGLDFSAFSEAQVAEALLGMQPSFPSAVVSGEPDRAGEAKITMARKAKANANGQGTQERHLPENPVGRVGGEGGTV